MKRKIKAMFLIGCLTVFATVTAFQVQDNADEIVRKEGRITPSIQLTV